MEYLMVVGFAFVMLSFIVVVAYSESSRFGLRMASAQMQRVSAEIVDTANIVYYAGPPTKKTVKLQLPQHIREVRFENRTIVFQMLGESGVYDYAVDAATNVTGAITASAGTHVLTFEAETDTVRITDG